MSSKQYLCDKKQKDTKTAVFTVGRFNPPTRGHQVVIDQIKQLSRSNNGDSIVFPTQSNDTDRNPLDWDTKVEFMKQHTTGIKYIDKKAVTAFNVIDYLKEEGYTDVYFVVGSDRYDEFNKRWTPYASAEFDHVSVINGGDRKNSSTMVDGMSSTKARKAAAVNDVDMFIKATGWNASDAKILMHKVRKGLGLEHNE